MKKTTAKTLDLFEAFHRLANGYVKHVGFDQKGQPVLVPESYDVGPKAKWNALKNLSRMRKVKDPFEEARKIAKLAVEGFALSLSLAKDPDAAIKVAQFEAAEDATLAKLGEIENEIDGLLQIPADEINIRRTDPNLVQIVEVLMSEGFIEGEPRFSEEKKT